MPRLSPASRSHGSSSNRAGQFVRFTEPQNERLHKARKHSGRSVQAFLHDAALKEIERVEAEVRTRGGRRDDDARARRDDDAPAPRGMGLRERFTAARTEDAGTRGHPPSSSRDLELESPPPAAPAPPAPGLELRLLAAYVANGREFSRSERRRRAIEMMRATVPSGQERARLTAELDAQVAALEGGGSRDKLFADMGRTFFAGGG